MNCLGIRRDESAARARRIPWPRNDRMSVAGREVFDWLPIFDLSTADVFDAIHDAGQSPHWIIARHPRSYDREDMVFDPIHYLPLLEHKIGALDQAAPLAGWELPDAFPTPDRGFAGPPHPPCPYPGNERRELSSQPKPKTAEIPKNTCLTAGAMVDPVGPQEPPNTAYRITSSGLVLLRPGGLILLRR